MKTRRVCTSHFCPRELPIPHEVGEVPEGSGDRVTHRRPVPPPTPGVEGVVILTWTLESREVGENPDLGPRTVTDGL